MSPELAQSVILGTAACWMANLAWKRAAGRPLWFAALYLAVPSVALGLQAAQVVASVEPGKWASVLITGPLTVAMIATTRPITSPLVQALARAEAQRAQEAARRAVARAAAREERAQLRGETWALAGLLRAETRGWPETRASV